MVVVADCGAVGPLKAQNLDGVYLRYLSPHAGLKKYRTHKNLQVIKLNLERLKKCCVFSLILSLIWLWIEICGARLPVRYFFSPACFYTLLGKRLADVG